MNAPPKRGLASRGLEALCGFGDVVVELSPRWVCVDVLGEDALDLSLADFVGRDVRDALPADLVEQVAPLIAEVLRDQITRSFERRVVVRGVPHWLEARLAPLDNGNVVVIARDIGTFRRQDDALRTSEELFRLMADHAPVMLWKAGLDAKCDFFNQRWLDFTGRPMERELGTGWAESIHFEDLERCMTIYLDAFVERSGFRMEYRMRRADGEFRWILDQGVPRYDHSGFQGYVGSCIDITEIRESALRVQQLADALGERLREREVLFREIHHRVKNNLQVVSSIFSLQARTLDEKTRRVLTDARNRVRAIALVHEKLCAASSFSEVDLGTYVRDLMRYIGQAWGGRGVEVSVASDRLQVGVDHAVACGLIMHELVVNALKHGFPDERRGVVDISIREGRDGEVSLEVRDDGVGIPPEVDVRGTERQRTLGLDIVATMVEQLDGRLTIGREGGTTVEVSFRR